MDLIPDVIDAPPLAGSVTLDLLVATTKKLPSLEAAHDP
jgi:hypothetical protein